MSQSRRIIVLSDGTGNSAAALWRTNVWRVYQALDLSNGRQVALYDDGVGTSSFRPLAMLGGAFGWGLKRNVLDLYRFVCRNWTDGAEVFAFGFSRGAFTIRVLIGLITSEGLVPFESESQLRRDAAGAYRRYRRRYASTGGLVTPLRDLRDLVIASWQRLRDIRPYAALAPARKRTATIRFLGLWDTVSAYGLPIEEMTRGADLWLWPMSPPDRKLHPTVQRACHALALDDARTTFHPMLWTERGENAGSVPSVRDERISQVWFAGMHSNVGGGYPDDALAHVSLTWILEEAGAAGLELKVAPDQVAMARAASDQDGRLYDSRHGLGGSYRYGPRKLLGLRRSRSGNGAEITPGLIRDEYWRQGRDDEVRVALPKVHESVLQRIRSGARAYAPINLPEHYAVVTADGRILPPGAHDYETGAEAAARARAQEHVWNLVWRRRLVYFASLAVVLYLAWFPWQHPAAPHGELGSRLSFVAPAIRATSAALPSLAARWTEAFASSPGWFTFGAGLLAGLLWLGGSLEQRIRDDMRTLWDRSTARAGLPNDWVFRFRTHRAYVAVVVAMKYYVVPTGFAALAVVATVVAVGRGIVAVESSLGWACRSATKADAFRTSSPCWSSGRDVAAGTRYRITVTPRDWQDAARPVPSPRGLETAALPWYAHALVPFRRHVLVDWFRPIARIGRTGNDETPLELEPAGDGRWAAELDARTSGPLYLFVNDAALPLTWLAAPLYADNHGDADVTVSEIGTPGRRLAQPAAR